MTTVAELTDDILERVRYKTEVSEILRLLNQAQDEISGRLLLPELQTQTTVDTDTSYNYTALPAGFQRNLHYCYSEDQYRQIKIHRDFRQILRMVSKVDESGYVFGVAVRGSYLHYQRVPSSTETLQIHYYEQPTALTAQTDTPSCIPTHLQRSLLVPYCCKEILSLFADNPKEFEYYIVAYERAEADLMKFIGVEASLPVKIGTEIDWNNLAYG